MKVSHWKMIAAVLAACLFFALAWAWCAPLQIRRITNDELSDVLDVIEAGNPNSAYWYSLIGVSKRTVYLEYGTMIHPLGFVTNRPMKTVLLIDKADINDANQDRIRALVASAAGAADATPATPP